MVLKSKRGFVSSVLCSFIVFFYSASYAKDPIPFFSVFNSEISERSSYINSITYYDEKEYEDKFKGVVLESATVAFETLPVGEKVFDFCEKVEDFSSFSFIGTSSGIDVLVQDSVLDKDEEEDNVLYEISVEGRVDGFSPYPVLGISVGDILIDGSYKYNNYFNSSFGHEGLNELVDGEIRFYNRFYFGNDWCAGIKLKKKY